MLEFILDFTKALKLISGGLFSGLIINGCINFIIKRLQFNEVIEAAIKRLSTKQETVRGR